MEIDDNKAAIKLVRFQMRRLQGDMIQLRKHGLDVGPTEESLAKLQVKLDGLMDERERLNVDGRRYYRDRKRPAPKRK
jgi:hypothetical protein